MGAIWERAFCSAAVSRAAFIWMEPHRGGEVHGEDGGGRELGPLFVNWLLVEGLILV